MISIGYLKNDNNSVAPYESVKVNGEFITNDLSYMRGHGTYLECDSENIKSNLCGQVESVNKLIIVHPLNSRYKGNTGDVVVGRVMEIVPKKWLIDIQGEQLSQLMLTSIGLPDGVQRRKTEEDELQMRTYFKENEIIVAEVQQINVGGTINLQTRNERYGKKEKGVLIKVKPNLVKTCPSHFLELGGDTSIVLGKNGYIWVQGSNAAVQALLFNILKAMDSKNLSISDISLQKAIAFCKIQELPLVFTRSFEGINKIAHVLTNSE
eukprot:NODE_369_length_9975_cov_0.256582.p3 type:complete len:266 gc:universal NODE_369_length_9975_cov_0.256582:9518-8721(-)